LNHADKYSNHSKNSEKKTEPATKAAQKNISQSITDWYYMTPKEVTARMIFDLIKQKNHVQADLWEEMNILQLELSNKKTVDFEPVIINFKDPSDEAFVKNRNIKTIFEVTMEEEIFHEMKTVLKLIFQEWGGFLCADTDDFKPIYEIDNT
jgi:hypothetical protein